MHLQILLRCQQEKVFSLASLLPHSQQYPSHLHSPSTTPRNCTTSFASCVVIVWASCCCWGGARHWPILGCWTEGLACPRSWRPLNGELGTRTANTNGFKQHTTCLTDHALHMPDWSHSAHAHWQENADCSTHVWYPCSYVHTQVRAATHPFHKSLIVRPHCAWMESCERQSTYLIGGGGGFRGGGGSPNWVSREKNCKLLSGCDARYT